MELYTVFVGGGEVNDTYFLNRQDAEQLAQKFIEDGYDDTRVVVISPEEVMEWFKP